MGDKKVLYKCYRTRNIDNDDEDEDAAYESPEDPFPCEVRRKATKEELDKDFDPNEEIGIKP